MRLIDLVRAQLEKSAEVAREVARQELGEQIFSHESGAAESSAENDFTTSLIIPTIEWTEQDSTLALYHCEDETDATGNTFISPIPPSVASGEFGNCWNIDNLVYAIYDVPEVQDHLLIQFWLKTTANSGELAKRGTDWKIELIGSKLKFTYGTDSITSNIDIPSNTWFLVTAQFGIDRLLVGIGDVLNWTDI